MIAGMQFVYTDFTAAFFFLQKKKIYLRAKGRMENNMRDRKAENLNKNVSIS